MRRLRPLAALVSSVVLFSFSGCGAKTGLLIPDSSIDGGFDAGVDTGIDAPVCMPTSIPLVRRGAQVMFVNDRSNSMNDTIQGEGRLDGDPRPSRWDILGGVLSNVLMGGDPLLEIGGKFYPSAVPVDPTPEEACGVEPGIDLAPAAGNVPALLSIFETTEPDGGTPTAAALTEVEAFFTRRPAPFIPRFIVLSTDGGPNCNADVIPGPPACVCTGQPTQCDPMAAGAYAPVNCLDDVSTVSVIERIATNLGIPTFVIGIDDPTRGDLADVLDRMAIAGERPRDASAGRRFYSIRDPDDLTAAFRTITDAIALCVFNLDVVPTEDAIVSLRVDDVLIARDPTRAEGWDFTRSNRSELTLFGGSCDRVTSTAGEVTATIECAIE